MVSGPLPGKGAELDIDDTNDMMHDGLQPAKFNAHAGGHRFLLPEYVRGLYLRGDIGQARPVVLAVGQVNTGHGAHIVMIGVKGGKLAEGCPIFKVREPTTATHDVAALTTLALPRPRSSAA